jgi:hypothetical protein
MHNESPLQQGFSGGIKTGRSFLSHTRRVYRFPRGLIGSTYRLPYIDMPRIDVPRLGSTFVSTYSIAMSPTSQYVMAPHTTYPIAMSPTSQHVMATARHVSTFHHSLHRACNTCDLSSQFKYSRAIFQILLDEPLIDTSLLSLLEYFVFLPLHLPIFPLHLVESKPPLPLAYINPSTSRTRDVGKREATFF